MYTLFSITCISFFLPNTRTDLVKHVNECNTADFKLLTQKEIEQEKLQSISLVKNPN